MGEYVWVVIVDWPEGSCDPMTYVKSVWSHEEAANEDAKKYGVFASVEKVMMNNPNGSQ